MIKVVSHDKLKILAGKAQLIGDAISAIPIANFFREAFPYATIYFPIAKKCSQMAPLFLKHPSIDAIYIFDGDEGPQSKKDHAFLKSCDIVINPCPPHPDSRYPNEFDIYFESWRMAGLSDDIWNAMSEEEKTPKLTRWFKPAPRISDKKIISIWPQAGYGAENKRNPSQEWYKALLSKLDNNLVRVVQYGHPNDFNLDVFHDQRSLSFFDQIVHSLSSDLIISTDSGSGLILGAYEANQITLLTDHWGNTNNPNALAPKNKNNTNFFAPNGCDNIDIDKVVSKINNILDIE